MSVITIEILTCKETSGLLKITVAIILELAKISKKEPRKTAIKEYERNLLKYEGLPICSEILELKLSIRFSLR